MFLLCTWSQISHSFRELLLKRRILSTRMTSMSWSRRWNWVPMKSFKQTMTSSRPHSKAKSISTQLSVASVPRKSLWRRGMSTAAHTMWWSSLMHKFRELYNLNVLVSLASALLYSVGQSIDTFVEQSTNQSFDSSTNQSIKKSINYPIIQSVNQSVICLLRTSVSVCL